MNLSLFIAKRYLFSKKSRNAINIISAISVLGVMIGTMALVVVLSIHNGFDGLMKSLFGAFDPDLKISLIEGKTFSDTSAAFQKIKNDPEIAHFVRVIEENVLIEYNEKLTKATLKGVSEDFVRMVRIDTMISEGDLILKDENQNFAVMGEIVAYYLGFRINYIEPVRIYGAVRSANIADHPEKALTNELIHVSGLFRIHPEIDMKYTLVPYDFAERILEYNNEVTAIEVGLADGANIGMMKDRIRNIVGEGFKIKDKHEQHEFINKTIQSEKWMIFLILLFVLLIASFNIVGSLTILIIEKKRDVAILQSMGAGIKLIRRIFLLEGWLISLVGALAGLLIGYLLALGQLEFKWLKLQASGTLLIDYYPVEIRSLDFLIVFLSVSAIGFLAAWYPVRYITKRYLDLNIY